MTARPNYLRAAFDQMQQSFGSVDGYLARSISATKSGRVSSSF
jgi:protein tyrosine/serine phosphatase